MTSDYGMQAQKDAEREFGILQRTIETASTEQLVCIWNEDPLKKKVAKDAPDWPGSEHLRNTLREELKVAFRDYIFARENYEWVHGYATPPDGDRLRLITGTLDYKSLRAFILEGRKTTC